jgi:hypothetical protein
VLIPIACRDLYLAVDVSPVARRHIGSKSRYLFAPEAAAFRRFVCCFRARGARAIHAMIGTVIPVPMRREALVVCS